MSKILPTAEKFLEHEQFNIEPGISFTDWVGSSNGVDGTAKRAMIEFAKLHVKANTEAILEATDQYMSGSTEEDEFKQSILNAYPDNLIQ